MNPDIIAKIEADIGERVESVAYDGVLRTSSGKVFFLKSGVRSRAYCCEANGLKELAKADVIKTAHAVSVANDYILTEYIRKNRPSNDFFERFGRQLARMHRFTSKAYGFYEDNFIGDTPQINRVDEVEKKDWTLFYLNERLLYQYRLAEKNGYATKTLKAGMDFLERNLAEILGESANEPPCLLHGDLWAGNYLCDEDNNPVLIDPAVYYGHREADLAMTKLFGGFSSEFYDAYQAEYPLQQGWQYREGIYKLYHLLNHLNLFGKSYLSDTEYQLRKYLTEW